jgi:hypothetical protein
MLKIGNGILIGTLCSPLEETYTVNANFHTPSDKSDDAVLSNGVL